MTVVVQARDRCRLCFSLLAHDRSVCCQKSFHLFKHIERRKIPTKKLNPYQIKLRNQTVCFQDLILRYLHTQLHPTVNCSNFICSDCSTVLLDIEQCAKYLRRTINQLKIKFNKTTRLRTASLSATFQKKKAHEQNSAEKAEQLPISQSDSEGEFDDVDDEEEFDEDVEDAAKSSALTSAKSSSRSKSSSTGETSSGLLAANNHRYDEDEDEVDDDIAGKSTPEKSQQASFAEFLHRLQANSMNALSGSNGLITTANAMNALDDSNPNLLQLRLAHFMAAQNLPPTHATDAMLSTFTNIQRNLFQQFLNDPMAAAQAAQAAAVAAVSATQIKANLTPMSLLASNMKQQLGSGRKRKSTPEKRIVTNHQALNNNGDGSSRTEQDSADNDHLDEPTNHPLELTLKSFTQSSRALSSPAKLTPDVHNLAINAKLENGGASYSQYYRNQHPSLDDDRRESATPNDPSLALSPSLLRRTAFPKRQKVSTPTNQHDYPNDTKAHSSQASAADLLSPNHQPAANDELNSSGQQKQQRKLDPRSCAECGKILFSDKTHLLHCQTHAKNEKQCWICGVQDDDIKKHITNEHGNQKFTNTGFKCQHCEKVFPVYADLEVHTREHTKKKPFECPICHKRFGQQGNLSCHLRIHSGVKPFTCANCGKAFRHSNSLRRHARTVHSASRGLGMSPGATSTAMPSSLLLTTATSSNSMVSMANDVHRLSTSEAYDDGTSGLMIASDDGESLQGPLSSSSAGAPSPSISNTHVDEDSRE